MCNSQSNTVGSRSTSNVMLFMCAINWCAACSMCHISMPIPSRETLSFAMRCAATGEGPIDSYTRGERASSARLSLIILCKRIN